MPITFNSNNRKVLDALRDLIIDEFPGTPVVFEDPERLKAYYFLDDFTIKNVSTELQSYKEVDKGDEDF